MTLKTLLGATCLTAVAFSFAPLAIAQDGTDAEARTLGTITVTAGKREQTLNEVPIAVTVVDDEVIERAQINDLLDLQSVVPSLRVSQLERSANTTFIIRGFGNGGNNFGIEPSVGVFIDGVYRPRSSGSIADFPDVARVEVLRGPQSTLFGKNASAGVISFVTEEPSFDYTGKIEGTIRAARSFLDIEAREGFSNWIWSHVEGRPVQTGLRSMAEAQAQTPASVLLSKNLNKAGFGFCGPVISYAFMQAAGLVNDHLVTCPRHAEVAAMGRG